MMIILVIVERKNSRRPIKKMPFNVRMHNNLLSSEANPTGKSLRVAMNYILLVEGSVASQRPLTAKSFGVFERRLRREEVYLENVVMGLSTSAIKSAKLYSKAVRAGKVRSGILRSSYCCNKILLRTGLYEEARCCICGSWFKGQEATDSMPAKI